MPRPGASLRRDTAPSSRSLEWAVKLAMACGAALALLGAWHRNDLPEPSEVLEAMQDAPIQTPTTKAAFDVTRGGVTYHVKPLFEYELRGLVVSRHGSEDFTDTLHAETADHLNVVDLCVVYGGFAREGGFRDFSYSSGNFTCYAQGHDSSAAFKVTDLSNNHLLAGDDWLKRTLRDVRIGDQVRLRGYLAEYSHSAFGPDRPFQRGTSTTRTDTGNGACETVYVTDFEMLRPAGSFWRVSMWTGILMLAGAFVALLMLPYRSPD